MNFLAILTIVFITLKLMGIIAWSWWLVILPIIPMIILGAMGYGFLMFLIIGSFIDFFVGKRK